MLDDVVHRLATAGQVDGSELAFEDRELQVVAEIAHRLKDFAEAFVIADVVTHQKGAAHGNLAFPLQDRP